MTCRQILISDISLDFIDSFNSLSSQLSWKTIKHSENIIRKILQTHDFYGQFNGKILVWYIAVVKMILPQWIRILLESFIIDKNYQNQWLWEKLLLFSVNTIRKEWVSHINLTCNSTRKIAEKLYLKTGFQRVDTNVFRYYF